MQKEKTILLKLKSYQSTSPHTHRSHQIQNAKDLIYHVPYKFENETYTSKLFGLTNGSFNYLYMNERSFASQDHPNILPPMIWHDEVECPKSDGGTITMSQIILENPKYGTFYELFT
mmetsp:Transcript_38519/g.34253  ORF Transcript_38519/g.34253 Transcript_38519/m.34253 type:complete len:117 (-) Transcript_38519:821-1171(-)